MTKPNITITFDSEEEDDWIRSPKVTLGHLSDHELAEMMAGDDLPRPIKVRWPEELGKLDWDESKHPRDKGKFASKPGAGAAAEEAPAAKPQAEAPAPSAPAAITPAPGHKTTASGWSKHSGFRFTKITKVGDKLTVWGHAKDGKFEKLGEYSEAEADKAFAHADQFLKSKGAGPTPPPPEPKPEPKPVKVTPAPKEEEPKPTPAVKRKSGAEVRSLITKAATEIDELTSKFDAAEKEKNQLYLDKKSGKIGEYTFEKRKQEVYERIVALNTNMFHLRKERNETFKKQLRAAKPSKVKAYVDKGFNLQEKQQIDAGINSFCELVGSATLPLSKSHSLNMMQIDPKLKSRSHFSEVHNAVVLQPHEGSSTIVHELGHWLEHHVPAVGKAAQSFLKTRTAGEKEASLKEITKKGYGKDEFCKADKFPEAYCGKLYPNFHDTEIVSMGLQFMHDDPVRFAQKDPEYFDFIYDVMSGVYK